MRTSQSSDTLQSGFKAWLSASDLSQERLPGVASTPEGAALHVKKIRMEASPFLWRRLIGAGVEVHYTSLPLDTVLRYEARHRPAVSAAQPGDRRLARLGKGVLSMAEGGRLRAFILQRMVAEPRLAICGVRDRCIERFGLEVIIIPQGLPILVPMPPLRTFHQFAKALRDAGMVDVQS